MTDGNFSNKLGIVLATAGSAVGLGNVWRFPFMTGQNGGAAFIIVYLGCILLLGIPGMVSEFIVGRHSQANAARAYAQFMGTRRGGWWAYWASSPRLSSWDSMPLWQAGACSIWEHLPWAV